MGDLSLFDLAHPGEHQRGARAERTRRRRRRNRRRRSFVVLAVVLVIFVAGAAIGYQFLLPMYHKWNEPKDYPGPGDGPVSVEVVEGDSGRTIGDKLVSAGVVRTSSVFADAFAANTKATRGAIQPGVYQLKSKMRAEDALASLLDPASKLSASFVIPEGRRAVEVYKAVQEATGVTPEQMQQAAKDPASGLPPEAGGQLEGYLFPAKYTFNPGVTPLEIVKTMVARYQATMTSLSIPQAQQRQLLIKASLVQVEAKSVQDMAKVSRVIDNRLQANMLLQFDSTVSYGAGSKRITTTEAERALDNPYNTYKRPGLPAGPISCPGKAAIQAAASPASGPWLYFVTVNPDTGETKFAVTAAEHAQNVTEFQAWLREHPR